MIRFTGRSRLRVYMPLKPIKYGFKAYVLTEATTGFVLNWSLYEGKKSTLVNTVQNLTTPFEKKGYIIAMDRFYTTIDVVNHLSDNGFGVFGAITKNRARLSPNIEEKTKALEKGQALFYYSNDKKLLMTIWKDSKVIHLVSNRGNSVMAKVERKCKAKGTNEEGVNVEEITCPKNIKLYSNYARGVDYMDQRISYYLPEVRSRKWYMPILLHMEFQFAYYFVMIFIEEIFIFRVF